MLKFLIFTTLGLSVACGTPGHERKKRDHQRQTRASDQRKAEDATATATEAGTTTSTSTAPTNGSEAADVTPPAAGAAGGEETIEPTALDLAGLQHASLRGYPVEMRCNGIKEALAAFVEQHAEGVTFEYKECNGSLFFDDVLYRTEFDLVKGDTRKTYDLWIYKIYESELEYKFSLVRGNESRTQVGSSQFYDTELAKLAPDLGHLHATMAAFVGKPTLEQTIFGHTYRDFIAQLTSLAVSPGIKTKDGDGGLPIKFELLPDDGSDGRHGIVRFIDVPAELLAAQRQPLGDPGFLGCTTIECLNEDLQATFEIEENYLRMTRPTSRNSQQIVAWTFNSFPG